MAKSSLNSVVTPSEKADAPIPLLDLGRQYSSIRKEILAAIERVCDTQHFILGAEGTALEQELADFCGTRAAVGCASGTDALWLALLAAGVQPGDAVLTTAFSFFASASAIVRAGGRPVFLDIDPQTLNLDHEQVENYLRTHTEHRVRALLPVHLYGQCADMSSLDRIASEFGIALVEDAAQAIGAQWKGKQAGSLGVTAAFSFYPTKNLSAYGDAGLVTTNDSKLAEHMRRLRNHGSPRRYLHEEFGWNSRLDEIQAAVLRVKLPHVHRWNELRRERAALYDRLFREAGLADRAELRRDQHSDAVDQQGPSEVGTTQPILLPFVAADAHHIFHQYVIRAHRRDELRQFLSDRKIGSEIYYPLSLHMQPSFAYLGYAEGDLPECERASREVLALPMFPELTQDEQQRVVAAIADFYS